MAKRFTDTDKWKKPLLKAIPMEYKLLWLYVCDDCDHAGIWHVDFDVAELRVGEQLSEAKAKEYFDGKIVLIDGGEKWFIPSFIEFQYGDLNKKNRAHESVIKKLNRYNLLNENLSVKNKEGAIQGAYVAPTEGAKDKDMDKEEDKDKEKGGLGEKIVLPASGFFCDSLPKDKKLTPDQVTNTITFIKLVAKKVITETDVGDRWEAFKILQFGKHEWYKDYESLLTHFRQSYKLELNNGKSVTGTKRNGGELSSTAVIKPDKTYNPVL